MKKYSFVIAACLLFTSVFSQEKSTSQRFFHSLGYSFITDFGSPPVKVETEWDPGAFVGYSQFGNPIFGAMVTNVYEDFGISYVTVFYRLRCNVLEFGDNSAFGLSATPALGGAYTNWEGAGYFNLPLQVEFGFGAGSTYNSSANKGGYIGAGVEINKLPILYTGEYYGGTLPISFWAQPVVSTGFRYWNKSNKMKEINFKLGFAVSSDPIPPGVLKDVAFPSITMRLSWISFLNY